MRFSFLLSVTIILFALSIETETINLSNYEYPKKLDASEGLVNIAIMGTNDIHGTFYPKFVSLNEQEDKYEVGGLSYLGKYISMMREDWGDRFLWFDGGDQFQGGLETRLGNGEIMTEFFNLMEVNASTFGNHEFDYGPDYLRNRTQHSKFPYVVSNIQNKTTKGPLDLDNVLDTKIFNIDSLNLKVGLIGITTITTAQTSTGDISQFEFLDYKDLIITKATALRNQGCSAVILLSHVGIDCYSHSSEQKYKLEMRDIKTELPKCNEKEELGVLLKSLPANAVDIVISAHNHDIAHQWIAGFPVISSVNNGLYSNLIYLTFKKENDKYIFDPNATLMEGPLPICEKIFEKTLSCDSMSKDQVAKSGELRQFTFHGHLMEKEAKLETLYQRWWSEYKAYLDQKLTETDGTLMIWDTREEGLGNLYTDFLRRQTGAVVSILNGGSFRVTWSQGPITLADVYNMSPFENTVTSYDMTGQELRRMIFEVQSGTKSFYPTSGLKQYVLSAPSRKLVDVRLFDGLKEHEIEDDKIYRIASNNFVIPYGGDDFKKVITWYKPRNLVDYGDFRDKVIEFLKVIPKIQTKKLIDEDNKRLRVYPVVPVTEKKNLREEIA